MGIEQDIKQKVFQSEHQKLFVNITYTNSYLTNLLSGHLKPFGLSMQQFNVLRILRGQHPNPVSINSITDRMIDKMSNASRLVEKLQLKEMVVRKKCPNDGRQVDVVLSTKGIETLKALDHIIPKFDAEFGHITEQEASTINALLDKLRKTK